MPMFKAKYIILYYVTYCKVLISVKLNQLFIYHTLKLAALLRVINCKDTMSSQIKVITPNRLHDEINGQIR